MIFRFTFGLDLLTFHFGPNGSFRISASGKTSVSEGVDDSDIEELIAKGHGAALSKLHHESTAYCEILPLSALVDLPIAGYPEPKEVLTRLDDYSQEGLKRIRNKTNKSIIYIISGNEGPLVFIYMSETDYPNVLDIIKHRLAKALTAEFHLYLDRKHPTVELIQGKPVFVGDFTLRFGQPS